MMVDHGQTHQPCPVFCKNFNKPCSLQEHMLSHTKDKLHSCGTCGIIFTSKGDFTKHIHNHFEDIILSKLLTCDFFNEGQPLSKYTVSLWG